MCASSSWQDTHPDAWTSNHDGAKPKQASGIAETGLKQLWCIGLQRGPLQLDDLHFKRRSYGAWTAYGAPSSARAPLPFQLPHAVLSCCALSCNLAPKIHSHLISSCVTDRRDLSGVCILPSGQSKAANILFAKELNRRCGHAGCTHAAAC